MTNLPQSPSPRPLLLVSANSSWNIMNFRAGLIAALIRRGYKVAVAAGDSDHRQAIEAIGASFHSVAMASSGLTPGRDSATLLGYWRLMRRLNPAAYLGFTAKPNIYGALAAGRLGIPVLANISGLGIGFGKAGLLRSVLTGLYRLALKDAAVVFFQNPDDRRRFLEAGLVREDRTRLLNGSGVNLSHFRSGHDRSAAPFHAVMIARMIWAKGVGEFVGAARRLRNSHPDARFTLVGPAGVENPDAVSLAELEAWAREGVVAYAGPAEDVRPYIEAADCVVLPSYYPEGVPRSLIEASAMSRPIITTSEPGCREILRDGVNGFLCEARSIPSLEAALERMIAMGAQRREEMGRVGRRLVEDRFSEEQVVDAYAAELDRIEPIAR